MNIYTSQNPISAILRLGYAGSPQVGTYGTVSTTETCYLRPLTEEQAALNGVQYGTSFSVIVECGVDIQEGDRLVINGGTYQVRGIVNHNRGRFTQYKKAIAQKAEKVS